MVEVILDGLMATLTLGVMLIYSLKLSAIVLAAFLVYVLVRVLSYRVQFEATSQQVIASAQQQSKFLEAGARIDHDPSAQPDGSADG